MKKILKVLDLKTPLGTPIFFAVQHILAVSPVVDKPGHLRIYTIDGSDAWECLGDITRVVAMMEGKEP